jgi:hypothetical protein
VGVERVNGQMDGWKMNVTMLRIAAVIYDFQMIWLKQLTGVSNNNKSLFVVVVDFSFTTSECDVSQLYVSKPDSSSQHYSLQL